MYGFHMRCSLADHYLFVLPVTSTTTSEDSAATPGSQVMSQDESGTWAKHLLLQLQAQRARWLSSAAAGVPAMKKFTSSLHFVCYKFAP